MREALKMSSPKMSVGSPNVTGSPASEFWSYALRNAGWSDDSPVWTGSCPCQSFSASGKRGGFSDKRHLWPAWERLIRECRPNAIYGEQVGSKDGKAWLDVVLSELEGSGYTVGAAITGACGFGAPHRRKRIYFVADTSSGASERNAGSILGAQAAVSSQDRAEHGDLRVGHCDGGAIGSVAHTQHAERRPLHARGYDGIREETGREQGASVPGERGEAGLMADSAQLGHERSGGTRRWRGGLEDNGEAGELGHAEHHGRNRPQGQQAESCSNGPKGRLSDGAGFTNGFWRDALWVPCRDGKYRPIQRAVESELISLAPGLASDLGLVRLAGGEEVFAPLVQGSRNRIGRLRGYGNAINAEQAQAFIESYLEVVDSTEQLCW